MLNQQLKSKYNPDYHYLQARRLLDDVNPSDAEGWYNHPCTQALRHALEGDLSGIVIVWLGGGYSDDKSATGTAQRNAKARGMAQAIEDMAQYIEEIKNLKLSGESVDDNYASVGPSLIG